MLNIKQIIYPAKNNMLEPLTVIIKLFIFSYYNEGSKLSILNNKLIIQENNYLQSTYRIINGDTKNDINILLFPIIYASQLYLLHNTQTKIFFEKIFKRVNLSFDKLYDTYKGEEIANNINNLRSIISSFLENDENKIAVILSNNITEIYDIKKNIYQHLTKIWNEDRLNILFGYINEILCETKKEMEDILIKCLSIFMDYIDTITNNMLKSVNYLF